MHNHVLSFDNLSTIRPKMADAFCRIATGGGFGTRNLHTDSDEVLFNATQPCLLNGIPALTEDSRSFLRSEARFGAALRRVQPVVRRRDISMNFNREGKTGMRVIQIAAG
ncbi:hypothetical protein [Falsihalocynthiibacter arcticus]|uniref:Uncharacterized protein n=1 Tax=Falsihalocynthiibacter arcticus TaxID=1579316 RepID=A0A126UZJ7_9RHOB|nr:hypothetical protein [Falsihalocynthiibacter arcticus]AML51135.1 hypothetical protein RC74_07560 [Falsihalocynthiibacter arcticus]